MPAEPRNAAGTFGVRPRVWLGLVAIVLSLLLLFQLAEDNAAPATKRSLPVENPPAVQVKSPASLAPPRAHRSGRPITLADSMETVLVGPDARAGEPVSVLINELFSPDPETRMLAAMRLSRRSVYASEAVPVLKKLSRDEQDARVRALMNEAILNIRGYAPPPFEQAIPKD